MGLDNQIPDAISGAFRGHGLSNMLAYSIVPPCALVAGKLEFHQIHCAKDIYKKLKSWWTVHFVALVALNKSSPEDF